METLVAPIIGAGVVVGGAVGGVAGSAAGRAVGVVTCNREAGQLAGSVVGGVAGRGNFIVPRGFGAVVGGCAGAGTGATAGHKGAGIVFDGLRKKHQNKPTDQPKDDDSLLNPVQDYPSLLFRA